MNETKERLEHIALAFDTDDRAEFSSWCAELGPRVAVVKVGLEAFVRWGSEAVEEARASGANVFLDLKLHDIPNTVAGATAAARDLGADYLTVHASGGLAMVKAAVAEAGEMKILAVTLLTHLDPAATEELDLPGPPAERVSRWAALARRAGASGVVCSPLEAARLRRENPHPFVLVTPGIRASSDPRGDQRRVAGPREALLAGSDLLVIGRPITRASDPLAALAELAREIKNGTTPR